MGSNTPKKTRAATTGADRTLIDGLGKHGAAIPSMVIAGQLLTAKDVVAVVQSRVNACAAAISAKAAWLAALEAEAGRLAQTDAFISGRGRNERDHAYAHPHACLHAVAPLAEGSVA